jgi:bacillithiol biosynthesis deacetylase BshB1
LKQIDCLAFGPHPDDVELFCGGVLIKLKGAGYTTAVADLTAGELSSNGDVETRLAEAEAAKRILNLDIRLNLGLSDGELFNTWDNRLRIVDTIRDLKPRICLVPFWQDRHPDHESASILLKRAIFDAGLKKIETKLEAYRPTTVLYYFLHQYSDPTFIVDISDQMDQKLKAINVYVSQFSAKAEGTTETYINKPDFKKTIVNRAEFFGQQIGVTYGEGFYYPQMLKIDNIIDFFT